MGLVDDLRAPTPRQELSRRAMLGRVTGGAVGVVCLGSLVTLERFMRPNVLFEPPTKFRVGRPEELPVGKVKFLEQQKLYVAHSDAGFYAMSAECTHLGCMTRYLEDEQKIVCPCHGSKFDTEGVVRGGPAPRPLDRLKVVLQEGQLVVDTRLKVDNKTVLKV